MKKLWILLMVLGLTLVGCQNTSSESKNVDEEMTVEHRLGSTTFKSNPTNVVVFDLGVLDTMQALDINVLAVPKKSLPAYLNQYQAEQYHDAGSLKEPNFEALSSLDIDLIIISGRQEPHYEALSELAPTLYIGLDFKDYLNSFKENVELVGKIFNKEDKVKKELASIDKKIEDFKKNVDESKKGLVVLANDGQVSAYGPGSRFGLIYDVLGITPVDTQIEVSTHGQSVTFEYILEKNPDYLFVIDRGAVVKGGTALNKDDFENAIIKKTKAYEDKQIYYLDGQYWYLSGGGLESFNVMIDEVISSVK